MVAIAINTSANIKYICLMKRLALHDPLLWRSNVYSMSYRWILPDPCNPGGNVATTISYIGNSAREFGYLSKSSFLGGSVTENLGDKISSDLILQKISADRCSGT